MTLKFLKTKLNEAKFTQLVKLKPHLEINLTKIVSILRAAVVHFAQGEQVQYKYLRVAGAIVNKFLL